MARIKTELLQKGWEHAYDKEDWQPPLGMALEGITEEQADWRPPGEAGNTIRENVHHLIFYKERFLNKWYGVETPAQPRISNTDTFQPAVNGAEGEAWEATKKRLAEAHAKIGFIIEAMDDAVYDKDVVKDSPAGPWLTSLYVHDAYHCGQIILLRKLQGSWSPTRSFD